MPGKFQRRGQTRFSLSSDLLRFLRFPSVFRGFVHMQMIWATLPGRARTHRTIRNLFLSIESGGFCLCLPCYADGIRPVASGVNHSFSSIQLHSFVRARPRRNVTFSAADPQMQRLEMFSSFPLALLSTHKGAIRVHAHQLSSWLQ